MRSGNQNFLSIAGYWPIRHQSREKTGRRPKITPPCTKCSRKELLEWRFIIYENICHISGLCPRTTGKKSNKRRNMFTYRRSLARKIPAALLFLAFCIFPPVPPLLHAAAEICNAGLIRQYVDEDKVYLLDNLRQKFSRPSEKLVIEALLSEDGPKALALYRKQLRDYPDPDLDRISNARIAAYSLALNSTAPPPLLSQPLPAARPKPRASSPVTAPRADAPLTQEGADNAPTALSALQEPPNPATGIDKEGFTLQFGSFGNAQNAESLSKKVSYYSGTEVVFRNGIYRVRLKKTWPTREDAADAGRQLPFDAIVVPARQ